VGTPSTFNNTLQQPIQIAHPKRTAAGIPKFLSQGPLSGKLAGLFFLKNLEKTRINYYDGIMKKKIITIILIVCGIIIVVIFSKIVEIISGLFFNWIF